MDYLRRSWAQIDLDAIKANYHELKKQVSAACKTMAIVKADAYGHGDGYVSRRFRRKEPTGSAFPISMKPCPFAGRELPSQF